MPTQCEGRLRPVDVDTTERDDDDDVLLAHIRYHERLAAVEGMYANELRVAIGLPLGPDADLWPLRRRQARLRGGGS